MVQGTEFLVGLSLRYSCNKNRILFAVQVARMELLFVHYVSLLYVVLFYFVWKRWYKSLSVGCGVKTVKRLRRCAPQVLERVARQQRQSHLFLECCLRRRHWLHYAFCYYYGGHANRVSSWCVAAGTLYCLWNNVHAASTSQCYVMSVTAFAGMTVPYRYGPYLGMMLAGSMPAFMRCEVCPSYFTAEQCTEFQRIHGCHACDRRNCWRANPVCPFFEFKSRGAPWCLSDPDAAWGDTVPHMRETQITCTADGSELAGRHREGWWERYHDVCFSINDREQFVMGKASGDQCNCLIDTLRQQLHVECDVRAVRAFVQARHTDLVLGDYLELQHHWRDVINGLAHSVGQDFAATEFKIVCVDAMFIGNGDVEGNGPRPLYIARQNANHFVPLLSRNTGNNDSFIAGSAGPSHKASDEEGTDKAEPSDDKGSF